MGLDVSFYASATLVHGDLHPRALTEPQPGPGEECYDHFTVVYVNPDFSDQADNVLHHACYETGKREAHIHHSYSGYNQFREWLCKAVLGVAPEVVWANPDLWWNQPLVPLIHFSDCEGVIGPQTSYRLASEFAQHRDRISADQDDEDMVKRYDEWAAAFALVGPTGFVRFA